MRLMRLCGVDIKVNGLLGIIFFIFFIFGYVEDLLISFIVVLLHEGAHVFTAKLLGYNIDNIEIFPFGGVARIEETIATNPQHEIMIAVSGPILNLIIVFMSYYLMGIFLFSSEQFIFFVHVNLVIGIFNLFPIVPLDGGRIVRAYLAYFWGFKRGTKIVVILSKILSCLLFLWGCYGMQYNKLNIYFSCLAIFLYIAAHKEKKMAAFIFIKEITQKKQHLLENGVLSTRYLTAVKSTAIKDIMNQFIPRKYHIITVMDTRCNVIAVLTENEVLNGMVTYGLNASLEKLLKI
ncbi:M50 family metallopeptidase [Marinisporobacter balticus]|uniref:Stage IV sporulation protein FB n=1 Tax=Marinisporobacter balticus TaxID=2018667 RepID=A0A4R2LKR6_9FIRM|nr:M50 family metallopeptidase [Marinisporobacter balticus]TCO79975.1 stage IV sporulation protein FB [Marinisporobacter balticus]